MLHAGSTLGLQGCHDAQDGQHAPAVPPGHLIALRTKAAVDSQCEFGEVYVIQTSARSTGRVIKVIDSALAVADRHALAHLRRVIKPDQIPPSVQCQRSQSDSGCPHPLSLPSEAELNSDFPLLNHDPNGRCLASHPTTAVVSSDLHVLLCRTSALTYQAIHDRLAGSGLVSDVGIERQLYTVSVPLTPPLSQEHAVHWSHDLWPTIYKKHNPFGPQHNIINDAMNRISRTAGTYVLAASHVGDAASAAGIGKPVGVIVVDRSRSSSGMIVAAAGDARWYGRAEKTDSDNGNPLAHSVMRAIGMVARRRKDTQDEVVRSSSSPMRSDCFPEGPLTLLEQEMYAQSAVEAGGYLCLDLELYVTHEPCVMCCMALLHSRFGKVIFGTRMAATGGLAAERQPLAPAPGLGYGLFWRPSLNWKFLVWQWASTSDHGGCRSEEAWHA